MNIRRKKKKMVSPMSDETPLDEVPAQKETPTARKPTLRWDDSKLTSIYANVANVSSSREEVVMILGVNQAWANEQPQVTVQLTHRLILTPSTAKRLSVLLDRVISEHEERFGALEGLDGNGEVAA